MTPIRYLILGAGPTGLGAAYRLKELGENDFLILERNGYPGGLAASFEKDGFTWDIGGHVQFSHYPYFDEVMRKALGDDGWLTHQRESWAWMEERFVPYPVQYNIRYFPKPMLWECLDGIIAANLQGNGAEVNNFREWILSRFGAGLARVFMFPYNFKVWAYPPELLSYSWIGERVAVTDLQRLTRNVVLELDDLSWGPNHTFRFPLHGGTGSIWKRVAKMTGDRHLSLNSQVEKVDTHRRVVSCTDGREYSYEHLISTIPLDAFVPLLRPEQTGLANSARMLKHSSSHIVGLGLAGEIPDYLRTKCWMYFPEANCPFYRATVFSNYSPNNVPDSPRFWSLMTETSESPLKPVSEEQILEDTIQGCINTKLIRDRSEVVSSWVFRAEHGYPTPSLERDAALQTLLPALESLGIHSRGRFGAWKYEVSNQDHSMMQGVELVNRLVSGIPETTIPPAEDGRSR